MGKDSILLPQSIASMTLLSAYLLISSNIAIASPYFDMQEILQMEDMGGGDTISEQDEILNYCIESAKRGVRAHCKKMVLQHYQQSIEQCLKLNGETQYNVLLNRCVKEARKRPIHEMGAKDGYQNRKIGQ